MRKSYQEPMSAPRNIPCELYSSCFLSCLSFFSPSLSLRFLERSNERRDHRQGCGCMVPGVYFLSKFSSGSCNQYPCLYCCLFTCFSFFKNYLSDSMQKQNQPSLINRKTKLMIYIHHRMDRDLFGCNWSIPWGLLQFSVFRTISWSSLRVYHWNNLKKDASWKEIGIDTSLQYPQSSFSDFFWRFPFSSWFAISLPPSFFFKKKSFVFSWRVFKVLRFLFFVFSSFLFENRFQPKLLEKWLMLWVQSFPRPGLTYFFLVLSC